MVLIPLCNFFIHGSRYLSKRERNSIIVTLKNVRARIDVDSIFFSQENGIANLSTRVSQTSLSHYRCVSFKGEGCSDLLRLITILHVGCVRSRCSTQSTQNRRCFRENNLSLSDSQQWVFTLTIVGRPLARTLRPSAARPRLPILFFSPQLHPPNAPSITGNGSSSVFIRACIHVGPYTKPAIDIYVYRIYSPSGIYSSNSKSIFPSGRKGSVVKTGRTLRPFCPASRFYINLGNIIKCKNKR